MNDLTLSFIFNVFKKNWLKILSLTFAAIIAAGAITHFLIPKKYTSSVKFYVYNINTNVDYTSTGLLEASSYLINDYIEIILSDPFMALVCEKLNEAGVDGIEPSHIRSMISHKTESDQTAVFTLSVTHTNKSLAYAITKIITDIAPTEVTKVAKPINTIATNIYALVDHLSLRDAAGKTPSKDEIENFLIDKGLLADGQVPCLRVLTYPQEAQVPTSPNITKNVFIAGVLALIISYVAFLMLALLKNTVDTEDDVKNLIGKPLLGAICSTTTKK